MKEVPNHVAIDPDKCKEILERFLIGASISRIEYFRTRWEISFSIADERQPLFSEFLEHPFEVCLEASEISPPDLNKWQQALASTPTDVVALSDRHDAIAALVLFNAVAYSVVGVEMRQDSTIEIQFDGARKLLVAGICPPIDEVWTLAPQSYGSKRAFGGPAFVQSYFGDLTADPRLLNAASN